MTNMYVDFTSFDPDVRDAALILFRHTAWTLLQEADKDLVSYLDQVLQQLQKEELSHLTEHQIELLRSLYT